MPYSSSIQKLIARANFTTCSRRHSSHLWGIGNNSKRQYIGVSHILYNLKKTTSRFQLELVNYKVPLFYLSYRLSNRNLKVCEKDKSLLRQGEFKLVISKVMNTKKRSFFFYKFSFRINNNPIYFNSLKRTSLNIYVFFLGKKNLVVSTSYIFYKKEIYISSSKKKKKKERILI